MTALEAVVAVAVIGGALGAAAAYQIQMVGRAKALALRADLQCLRAAVEFFHATRGRYPVTLEEMLTEPLGGVRGERVRVRSLRELGQQRVDAFGNPYYYSAVEGVVRSTTPDHETW